MLFPSNIHYLILNRKFLSLLCNGLSFTCSLFFSSRIVYPSQYRNSPSSFTISLIFFSSYIWFLFHHPLNSITRRLFLLSPRLCNIKSGKILFPIICSCFGLLPLRLYSQSNLKSLKNSYLSNSCWKYNPKRKTIARSPTCFFYFATSIYVEQIWIIVI